MRSKFLTKEDLDGIDYSNERTVLKEIAFQLSRIADVLEKKE